MSNIVTFKHVYPDLDPDPVGSALIWVRVSGSEFRMQIRIQRYKMKGNAEFNPQSFFFRR